MCVVCPQLVLGGWDEELPQLKTNPLKATILKLKREHTLTLSRVTLLLLPLPLFHPALLTQRGSKEVRTLHFCMHSIPISTPQEPMQYGILDKNSIVKFERKKVCVII